MIFVTVGTHEQPFNRVIKEIDLLVGSGVIEDYVFIQTGFSTYIPKNCDWSKLISYDEMQKKIEKADIVITHGGPSSFLNVLQYNKTPIVVPRREKFNEHVNDHQIDFLNEVIKKGYYIIKIESEKDLGEAILNYKNKSSKFISNNAHFNSEFKKIVHELIR